MVSARTFFYATHEVFFSLNVMMPLLMNLGELSSHQGKPDPAQILQGGLVIQPQTYVISLCVAVPFSQTLVNYDEGLTEAYRRRKERERRREEDFVRDLIEKEEDYLDLDERSLQESPHRKQRLRSTRSFHVRDTWHYFPTGVGELIRRFLSKGLTPFLVEAMATPIHTSGIRSGLSWNIMKY